jgi:transcription antitermination factor NusG
MFSDHTQPHHTRLGASSGQPPETHAGNAACGQGEMDAEARWFAVWTRSRQEKTAAAMLDSLGVPHFLPLKSESRQWSDRRQTVSVPLFSGYLFVRMNLLVDRKLCVLQVPGVAGFVGNSQGPLPIPDQQVEAVRAVVERGAGCTVHSLLEAGSLVRVVRGPLTGVEGRLVRVNSASRLVVSIELIHRSLAVSVATEDVEPVDPLRA